MFGFLQIEENLIYIEYLRVEIQVTCQIYNPSSNLEINRLLCYSCGRKNKSTHKGYYIKELN